LSSSREAGAKPIRARVLLSIRGLQNAVIGRIFESLANLMIIKGIFGTLKEDELGFEL